MVKRVLEAHEVEDHWHSKDNVIDGLWWFSVQAISPGSIGKYLLAHYLKSDFFFFFVWSLKAKYIDYNQRDRSRRWTKTGQDTFQRLRRAFANEQCSDGCSSSDSNVGKGTSTRWSLPRRQFNRPTPWNKPSHCNILHILYIYREFFTTKFSREDTDIVSKVYKCGKKIV